MSKKKKTYVVICDAIQGVLEDNDYVVPQNSADLNEVIEEGIVFNSDHFENFDHIFEGKVTWRNDSTSEWSNPNAVLRAECEKKEDAIRILQWIAEDEGEVMLGDKISTDYIDENLYNF